MQVRSTRDCRKLVDGLDHPEAVAAGLAGELFCGGEAGQVYRISEPPKFEQIAQLSGFVAGVTVEASGALLVCDVESGSLVRVAADGASEPVVTDLVFPNFAAFDPTGNLFLTDSGDYNRANGRLLLLRPDGDLAVLASGLHYPNGLAVDPAGASLYLAQSTASNILRYPIAEGEMSAAEIFATIPGTVPDGLALAESGQLFVGCYSPDAIYVLSPLGEVQPFLIDPWADLLNRPTNLVLGDGVLYYANLGGYHIGAIDLDERGAPIHKGNAVKAHP
ncbi:MAG TPA: SMP-30/gluconolactonase/LRE family protein [Acidimicrobiia bacterium]|nr:SMP-30/gluconolactonase/LRE family protein [Acidimicrobiia bacterium]